MVLVLLVAAMLAGRFMREIPFGRTLHFYLVEEPMRLAGRIERAHLIYLAILLVAGQALIMAAPLELAMIAAWDISLFMDAVIATWTAATVARGKGAWRAFAARFRPRRSTARPPARRRTRRPRRTSLPANDEDGRGWALAA